MPLLYLKIKQHIVWTYVFNYKYFSLLFPRQTSDRPAGYNIITSKHCCSYALTLLLI